MGKNLAGKPGYEMIFDKQKDDHAIHSFGDSDSAGEMQHGDHTVKKWSSTRSRIALSTGEAELYAINKNDAIALVSKSC